MAYFHGNSYTTAEAILAYQNMVRNKGSPSERFVNQALICISQALFYALVFVWAGDCVAFPREVFRQRQWLDVNENDRLLISFGRRADGQRLRTSKLGLMAQE